MGFDLGNFVSGAVHDVGSFVDSSVARAVGASTGNAAAGRVVGDAVTKNPGAFGKGLTSKQALTDDAAALKVFGTAAAGILTANPGAVLGTANALQSLIGDAKKGLGGGAKKGLGGVPTAGLTPANAALVRRVAAAPGGLAAGPLVTRSPLPSPVSPLPWLLLVGAAGVLLWAFLSR